MSNVLFPVNNKQFQYGRGFEVDTNGTLCEGLVSYWKFEGNSNDFFNSNNGTDTSVTYGTAYGKVNEGVEFTTSSSKIDVGAISTPTSAFSISLWYYLVDTNNYYGIFTKYYGTGSAFTYGIQTWNGGTGDFQYLYSQNGTNQYLLGAHHYTKNAWHHIVFTWTAGGTMYAYVDGVLDNSGSVGSGNLVYAANNTLIGLRQDNVVQNTGYIDEVGFWSKALSTQEITDLYNSGAGQTMVTSGYASQSLTQGEISYYKLDGNSGDFIGTNYGTDTSVTYGTSYGKVNEGALFGSSSQIINTGSTLPSGNGSYSLASWFKTTFNDTYATIVSSLGSPSTSNAVSALQINRTYHNLLWSNWNVSYTSTTAPSVIDGAWHFAVVTYDGTTIKLYQDNVLITSGTPVTQSISQKITIGSALSGNTFVGDIDEVGIWSKALSTQEISDLYNTGSGQTMVGTLEDTQSIAESTSLTLTTPPLTISVSDSETITESVSLTEISYNVNLSVFDSESVSDSATVEIPYLGNISVNDTETATDSPSLNIPTLFINVADTESATDVVIFHEFDFIVDNDIVSTSESVTILIPELYVSVSDSESATENVAVNIPIDISVYETEDVVDIPLYYDDQVDITEEVIIDILGANLLPSVFDTETPTESVTIKIPNLGNINVSDSESITEFVSLYPTSLNIDVSDSDTVRDYPFFNEFDFIVDSDTVTTTEEVSLVITPLLFSVEDSEIITDSPSVDILISLSVEDTVSITESVSVHIQTVFPDLISVFDSESATENIVVEIPTLGNINVSDSEAITESISIYETSFNINVYDTEVVRDYIFFEEFNLVIDDDVVTITENISLVITPLLISVDDSEVVTEFINIFLTSLDISVYDQVSITEFVSLVSIQELSLSVFDIVSISESIQLKTTFYYGTFNVYLTFGPSTVYSIYPQTFSVSSIYGETVSIRNILPQTLNIESPFYNKNNSVALK